MGARLSLAGCAAKSTHYGKFKRLLLGSCPSQSSNRERWPSGLRRTLGKRVYRKVPWVRIPLSPPETDSIDFTILGVHEIAMNPQAQRARTEHGGFCSLHTWQYESIASPQGTCSGYPALLNHLATSCAEAATAELTSEAAQSKIGGCLQRPSVVLFAGLVQKRKPSLP